MSNQPPEPGMPTPDENKPVDSNVVDTFFSATDLNSILGDTQQQVRAHSGTPNTKYSGVTTESDPSSSLLTSIIRERIDAVGSIVYEHIPKEAKRVLICFQNDHGDGASVQRMQDRNLAERKAAFINHNQRITEFGQETLVTLPPEMTRFFFESFPLDSTQWDNDDWGKSPLPEDVLNAYPSNAAVRDKFLEAIATMSKGDAADQGFAKELLAMMSPSKRITRAATEQGKQQIIFGDGFPESRDDSLDQALDGHANIAEMVKEHLPKQGVGMLVYGEEHFGSCARQQWPEFANKYFEDYLTQIPDLQIIVVEESHLPQLHT